MIDKDVVVKEILVRVMGELALGTKLEDIAARAYEMGEAYAQTKRFDNSRFYHNYQYVLDDGSKVSATNFYNVFMTRSQTPAYMEAEKIVKELFEKHAEAASASAAGADAGASSNSASDVCGSVTCASGNSASATCASGNSASATCASDAGADAIWNKAKADYLFHFVRNERFGINGMFKAVYQPHEPQQLSIFDYILAIACFCAGVLNNR